MDFDPNAAAPRNQAPTWGTYVERRVGKKFKVYTNRGHALNSCLGMSSILYKWDDDSNQWLEVSRHERGQTDHCWVCGGEIKRGRYYTERAVWERDERGKIVDLPRQVVVCGYQCQHAAEDGDRR